MGSADLLNLLLSVGYLSILILTGTLLRAKVKLFQKLYLPASLIGGIIGIILGPYALKIISNDIVSIWSILPGRLIDIVFACMFLGAVVPKIKEVFGVAGPQLTYAWILDSMQWIVSLGVAALIIAPIWNIDPVIGTIVEIGWAGGHGTAGGMVEVFNDIGFPEGGDLGLTSATVGLLNGVVFGVIMINIAVRKGYCEIIKSPNQLQITNLSGVLPKEEKRITSRSVILNNSIEPFAFHFSVIAIAILIGRVISRGLSSIHPILSSVPLFPLAMIGGLVIQIVFSKLKAEHLVDKQSVERIQGMALDYLVAAAVASIRIPVVIEYAGPLLILMGTCMLMMVVVTWFLPRIFFRDAWFERGIAEFGALSGVLAIGLLLLRVVDPDMETNAPRAFALERPFFSPFLGGGLITSIMPILVVQMGVFKVIGLWTGILGILLLIAFFFKWIQLPRKVTET